MYGIIYKVTGLGVIVDNIQKDNLEKSAGFEIIPMKNGLYDCGVEDLLVIIISFCNCDFIKFYYKAFSLNK